MQTEYMCHAGAELERENLKDKQVRKVEKHIILCKGQNLKAIFIKVTKVEKHFMQRAKLQGQKLYK